MSEPVHVISLGAGVQSSCMALMAAAGEITPMPTVAVFADTGWERRHTYDWLDWLQKQLPYPVARVSKGNIREDQVKSRVRGYDKAKGERWAAIPYFVESGGMVRRQCTKEYKIGPITKYLREEILGLKRGRRAKKGIQVVQWRGISVDEASRMKPSDMAWMEVRYPLAMELGLKRNDCIKWMQDRFQRTAPRSACVCCPYHSDDEWRDIKGSQEEWNELVQFDRKIRTAGGLRGKTYLHRSLRPMDEVDLSTPKDRGQMDMFDEECEGMCGL